MIVCHCKRVSDSTIRAAVQQGARSHREVGKACGAGTCCGGCRPLVAQVVKLEEEGQSGLPFVRALSR